MNKVLFAIGALLLLMPLGFRFVEEREHEKLISTYWEELEEVDESEMEKCFESARSYNEALYETGLIDLEGYETELYLYGNGMMGTIEIPKISVKLPIYHGTEEDVLASGIGHLKESSLPVGGENSHSVLSGHRGLPNAQLFTRLDELEEGDIFSIQICNQRLNYRVCDICVVEPEETEGLVIQAGRDLVSLVTCTPYGINTHRLVVTGERVTEESVENNIEINRVSKRDLILFVLPFLFLLAAVVQRRRRKRCEGEEVCV
ncbi:MAG: class C sortase [Tyzzerella sp.]|nr:class C sortase [Tyzzerella sp.]